MEAFLQKERAAKEKEAAQKAAQERTQRMLEADEDDSDSDSDNSDSDDENEVERALGDEVMDTIEDHQPSTDALDLSRERSSRGRKRKSTKDRGVSDGQEWTAGLEVDDGQGRTLLSFDIYLKGNVSRTTSFFKSAEGQTQRFRMFPYVEKKRKVDEYGETIDVGMWLRRGKALEEDAESDEVKEMKRKKEEEEAKVLHVLLAFLPLLTFLSQNLVKEPPSKFVASEIEVQLACRLLFVDLEGLNDGRAVKTIVPQVNPRKMVHYLLTASPSSPFVTDALFRSSCMPTPTTLTFF